MITHPTDPFAISEARDQEIGEFCVAQKRGETDFEASNFVKESVVQPPHTLYTE